MLIYISGQFHSRPDIGTSLSSIFICFKKQNKGIFLKILLEQTKQVKLCICLSVQIFVLWLKWSLIALKKVYYACFHNAATATEGPKPVMTGL